MEREKLIKHFQYSKEGFAMFTSEGREILSNILFIQFINVISDTQIHQVEDVTDIAELEPIRTFLNKNIRNLNRKKKVLRESVTIDKNGKIFLIECILFLDNSYEISINDISRQEEERTAYAERLSRAENTGQQHSRVFGNNPIQPRFEFGQTSIFLGTLLFPKYPPYRIITRYFRIKQT